MLFFFPFYTQCFCNWVKAHAIKTNKTPICYEIIPHPQSSIVQLKIRKGLFPFHNRGFCPSYSHPNSHFMLIAHVTCIYYFGKMKPYIFHSSPLLFLHHFPASGRVIRMCMASRDCKKPYQEHPSQHISCHRQDSFSQLCRPVIQLCFFHMNFFYVLSPLFPTPPSLWMMLQLQTLSLYHDFLAPFRGEAPGGPEPQGCCYCTGTPALPLQLLLHLPREHLPCLAPCWGLSCSLERAQKSLTTLRLVSAMYFPVIIGRLEKNKTEIHSLFEHFRRPCEFISI